MGEIASNMDTADKSRGTLRRAVCLRILAGFSGGLHLECACYFDFCRLCQHADPHVVKEAAHDAQETSGQCRWILYRHRIEEFAMRPILLCIVLVLGLATPACGQQLKEITNSIGMKLVLIHSGSFTMGSHLDESGRKEREIQHEVRLTKSFYLGVYEVTQGQYESVIGDNPNRIKTNPFPIRNVSWEDAVSFCTKLSELPEEKAVGRVYRLPTEAEWEYACRATSGAAFSMGDSAEFLEDFAWFRDVNEVMRWDAYPVGQKRANRWGLYDMHGNVYEWCQDWYAEYPSSEVTNPKGPSIGLERVFRGGCSSDLAANCRSSYRYSIIPKFRSNEIGFRVALTWPTKP